MICPLVAHIDRLVLALFVVVAFAATPFPGFSQPHPSEHRLPKENTLVVVGTGNMANLGYFKAMHRVANARGLHLLIVDSKPHFEHPALPVNSYSYLFVRNIEDWDNLYDAVTRYFEENPQYRLAAVDCNDDFKAIAAAYLRRKYQVPGLQFEDSIYMQDKVLSRVRAEQAGLAQPEYRRTISHDTVGPAEDTLPTIRELLALGQPVVLKPAESAASTGVEFIQPDFGDDQIRRAITRSYQAAANLHDLNRPNYNPSYAIVEQYIDGLEVIVEAAKAAGEVHVVGLLAKPQGSKEYLFWSPDQQIREPVLNALLADVEKLMKSFSSDNFVAHLEFKIDRQGRPFFIEINPRLGGGLLPYAYSQALGHDVYEITARLGLGENPLKNLGLNPPRSPIAMRVLYADTDGVYEGLAHVDSLVGGAYQTSAGVLIVPRFDPGTWFERSAVYGALGYVFAQADTAQAAAAEVEKTSDALGVQVSQPPPYEQVDAELSRSERARMVPIEYGPVRLTDAKAWRKMLRSFKSTIWTPEVAASLKLSRIWLESLRRFGRLFFPPSNQALSLTANVPPVQEKQPMRPVLFVVGQGSATTLGYTEAVNAMLGRDFTVVIVGSDRADFEAQFEAGANAHLHFVGVVDRTSSSEVVNALQTFVNHTALDLNHPNSAAVGIKEGSVGVVAAIADHFGVRGYSEQEAELSRSKTLMVDTWRQAGLLQRHSSQHESWELTRSAIEQLLAQGHQVIVKPDAGGGSVGVVEIHTPDEIEAKLHAAHSNVSHDLWSGLEQFQRPQVVVESKIRSGIELSIDVLIFETDNGRHIQPLIPMLKAPVVAPYFIEQTYFSLSPSSELYRAIHQHAVKLMQPFGWRRGLFHLEFVFGWDRAGQLWVEPLEVGARIGGALSGSSLFMLTAGRFEEFELQMCSMAGVPHDQNALATALATIQKNLAVHQLNPLTAGTLSMVKVPTEHSQRVHYLPLINVGEAVTIPNDPVGLLYSFSVGAHSGLEMIPMLKAVADQTEVAVTLEDLKVQNAKLYNGGDPLRTMGDFRRAFGDQLLTNEFPALEHLSSQQRDTLNKLPLGWALTSLKRGTPPQSADEQRSLDQLLSDELGSRLKELHLYLPESLNDTNSALTIDVSISDLNDKGPWLFAIVEDSSTEPELRLTITIDPRILAILYRHFPNPNQRLLYLSMKEVIQALTFAKHVSREDGRLNHVELRNYELDAHRLTIDALKRAGYSLQPLSGLPFTASYPVHWMTAGSFRIYLQSHGMRPFYVKPQEFRVMWEQDLSKGNHDQAFRGPLFSQQLFQELKALSNASSAEQTARDLKRGHKVPTTQPPLDAEQTKVLEYVLEVLPIYQHLRTTQYQTKIGKLDVKQELLGNLENALITILTHRRMQPVVMHLIDHAKLADLDRPVQRRGAGSNLQQKLRRLSHPPMRGQRNTIGSNLMRVLLRDGYVTAPSLQDPKAFEIRSEQLLRRLPIPHLFGR